MSLVRVGMGENKKYQDGFNAIFGKKKAAKKPAPAPAAEEKKADDKKKK